VKEFDKPFWGLVALAVVTYALSGLAAEYCGSFKEWSQVVLPPAYWPALILVAAMLLRDPLRDCLKAIAVKIAEMTKGPYDTEFRSPLNFQQPATAEEETQSEKSVEKGEGGDDIQKAPAKSADPSS
jgi:hypothetical protein